MIVPARLGFEIELSVGARPTTDGFGACGARWSGQSILQFREMSGRLTFGIGIASAVSIARIGVEVSAIGIEVGLDIELLDLHSLFCKSFPQNRKVLHQSISSRRGLDVHLRENGISFDAKRHLERSQFGRMQTHSHLTAPVGELFHAPKDALNQFRFLVLRQP